MGLCLSLLFCSHKNLNTEPGQLASCKKRPWFTILM